MLTYTIKSLATILQKTTSFLYKKKIKTISYTGKKRFPVYNLQIGINDIFNSCLEIEKLSRNVIEPKLSKEFILLGRLIESTL